MPRTAARWRLPASTRLSDDEFDYWCDDPEDAYVETGGWRRSGTRQTKPCKRKAGGFARLMARIGSEIEYHCDRCGGVASDRSQRKHREEAKKCRDAKAADVLFKVKVEAPPPAPIGIAQMFAGAPFVYTPGMPDPPRTKLPEPSEPTAPPPAKRKRGVAASVLIVGELSWGEVRDVGKGTSW